MIDSPDDSIPADIWLAAATATRLQVKTVQGQLGHWLAWERLAVPLAIGLHVDTVLVRLQRDTTVSIAFVDTLDVAAVTMPAPAVAVADLFRGGSLSEDQRALLDRQGNNNGRFDLGDFLAWVDRAQIHLSASVMAELRRLPMVPADGRTAGAKATGPPRP